MKPPTRRFTVGIVSPWPTVKNAEYEIIERMKIALADLGHTHLIIDGSGKVIEGGSQDDLDRADFCISMHFVSPKLWEPFTYLAMWNPPRYYHDGAYDAVMTHVGTYDDFLLYESTPIRNHLLNYLRGSGRSIDGALTFYSGGAGKTYPPSADSLKTPKLFYCGINWERITQTNGRHHALLQLLDKSGLTKIYGPEKFEGIRPWAGFETYQGSIPFDGVSLYARLRDCGVALVLSSYDHVKSEAASNRIYEACAAGVVILADRNPFIVKEFGDRIRYFDYAETWDQTAANIQRELDWIAAHPQEALELARRSQEHYLSKYTLESGLASLIANHGARSAQVENGPSTEALATVLSVFPAQTDDSSLMHAIDQLARQTYTNFEWIVSAPTQTCDRARRLLDRPELADLARRTAFVSGGEFLPGFRLPRCSVGTWWQEGLANSKGLWVTNLTATERWHRSHLKEIDKAFARDPNATVSYSGFYVSQATGGFQLGALHLDRSEAGKIVRLERSLHGLPIAFKREALPVEREDLRHLLSLIESDVPQLAFVLGLQSGSLTSTHRLTVCRPGYEENWPTTVMTFNYLRDFFRNDPGYSRVSVDYPVIRTSEISFHAIRSTVLAFFRQRLMRTRYWGAISFVYKKFIMRLIY